MKNYNLIIIIGTTATGKTKLSVELAKVLNTEIINADSTQVYKYLNIGTAKASEEEMQGIKHHLMSFLEPDQEYSVSEFKNSALKIIEELHGQNKIPIVVGGSGFYIESLVANYNYANSFKNEEVREKYNKLAQTYGKEYVYKILKEIDSESAKTLHPNDLKRVIRALEIYEITGKTKSQLINENTMQNSLNSTINNTTQNKINPLIIGLTMQRELLYQKINMRTDIMLNNGLLDEVKELYNKGYSSNLQSIKSIGYKELYDYLNGTVTLDEAIDKIKQNTRNYAKRQITWFKRFKDAVWFDVSKLSFNEIINEIIHLLNK